MTRTGREIKRGAAVSFPLCGQVCVNLIALQIIARECWSLSIGFDHVMTG